jgi:hypothetical protein
MKPQFVNNAVASFLFWSENELLTKGEAYKNFTSKLYYAPDPRLGSSYNTFASPFKQWVYNQGISGANIMSGVSGSVNLTNYQSGLQIDYDNGRVILPSSLGTGLNITGSYAFKEVNFYLSNETEEFLITDNKYYLNSRFIGQAPSGKLPPYDFVNPAIFIVHSNVGNEPIALGGMKDTEINLSMVVMVETSYHLDAILGIYADSEEKSFPLLSIYDDPINEYGNVKQSLYPSGFNYSNIIAEKGQPGNLLYIKSVAGAKVSDRIKLNSQLFAGVVDFTVSKFRMTN